MGFDRILIDGVGVDALELIRVGMAQRGVLRDVGEYFLDRFILKKAVDQLAVVESPNT